jgi:thiamine-phosphate diphosphorylase/hydroxyethylthiazole kinase
VHVGQSDMPASQVRALIGDDAILGVSVSSVKEAEQAVKDGVDYVGIGAVWPTASKDVTAKPKLAPSGTGALLDALAAQGEQGAATQAVAIGGIHAHNTPFLLHGAVGASGKALDGVAVISAIVASDTPKEKAAELRAITDAFKASRARAGPATAVFPAPQRSAEELVAAAAELFAVVRDTTPLVHQITNAVVINDSANATLAIGASPIMATNPSDCADLSPIIGALLINFGTITDKEGMFVAGRHANYNSKPLVFDPVAVGATSFRRETSRELLAAWQPTVIKGNAAEIAALAERSDVVSRGVDSVGAGFKDPAEVVRTLARRRRAIVVMTGVQDYISDGATVLKTSNGHELLGVITGSGCMTGTLVATFCAAARTAHIKAHGENTDAFPLVQGDMLAASLAGVLAINVAAERAAAREDVRGPGTFRAALMDELYAVRPEDVLQRANVEVV